MQTFQHFHIEFFVKPRETCRTNGYNKLRKETSSPSPLKRVTGGGTNSCFKNPPFTNPCFTNPLFTNPCFTNPPFTNPPFTNPCFTNPCFTNPDHLLQIQSNPVHSMFFNMPLNTPFKNHLPVTIIIIAIVYAFNYLFTVLPVFFSQQVTKDEYCFAN